MLYALGKMPTPYVGTVKVIRRWTLKGVLGMTVFAASFPLAIFVLPDALLLRLLPFTIFSPFVLLAGLLLARFPLARKRNISVDPNEVRIGKESIPTASFESALVVPGKKAGGAKVVLSKRFGGVEFVFEDENEAHRLAQATALGNGKRRERIPITGAQRPGAASFVQFTLLTITVLGWIAGNRVFGSPGTVTFAMALASFNVMHLAFILGRRGKLEIASDGIAIRSLLSGSSFIPFDDIASRK